MTIGDNYKVKTCDALYYQYDIYYIGVEVGASWLTRMECSRDGVHRYLFCKLYHTIVVMYIRSVQSRVVSGGLLI